MISMKNERRIKILCGKVQTSMQFFANFQIFSAYDIYFTTSLIASLFLFKTEMSLHWYSSRYADTDSIIGCMWRRFLMWAVRRLGGLLTTEKFSSDFHITECGFEEDTLLFKSSYLQFSIVTSVCSPDLQ